jgi:hypothetical protein
VKRNVTELDVVTWITSFARMAAPFGIEPQRVGWSAAVWTAVAISGGAVRGVISANDSQLPFGFLLAALWVVAAVCAVQWTVDRWMGRNTSSRRRG